MNIPGWHTTRKIVVFESDDWGAIRMPDLEARNRLIKKGVKFPHYGYDDVDTLASEEDLSALFDVLMKFRDKNGNCPVITANTIVANPDFEKIQASGYREYHYELFTETLKRYPRHQKSFELWKQGIDEGIFYPQFHGREHLNVQMWLHSLQKGHKGVREAFSEGVFSCLIEEDARKSFNHSYNIVSSDEIPFVESSIREGLSIFEALFGYKSSSSIAPKFTWDDFVEKTLNEMGVRYLQGGAVQVCSQLEGRKKRRRYSGTKNDLNQIYLIRNASFEPSQNKKADYVSTCLKEIANSFFWYKPAIISVHRLNFIGDLSVSNRENNLQAFTRLLKEITRRYPDVEFFTTDRLGRLIESGAV